jgi:hypothetical protein
VLIDEDRPHITAERYAPPSGVSNIPETLWLSVNGKSDGQVILGNFWTPGVHVRAFHARR